MNTYIEHKSDGGMLSLKPFKTTRTVDYIDPVFTLQVISYLLYPFAFFPCPATYQKPLEKHFFYSFAFRAFLPLKGAHMTSVCAPPRLLNHATRESSVASMCERITKWTPGFIVPSLSVFVVVVGANVASPHFRLSLLP